MSVMWLEINARLWPRCCGLASIRTGGEETAAAPESQPLGLTFIFPLLSTGSEQICMPGTATYI
jgi:hypothetical protein